MEAFSFGSYYPGDSAIHRLDPRTKLLLGFVFLITTLTVSSFRGLVPVAIFVVLIYTVSRVPARRVLSSMAPLLAIVAVVAVAAVGFAGHMIAHHVGGFYARIEEEDERARMEEEQAAKNAAQEENHQKGETQ